MCGIAGYILRPSVQEDWTGTLDAMADAQRHRGPDCQGIWHDPDVGVGLAHSRLSIIDLSPEGRQPMVSPSGRYILSYNGEVYNFKGLRRELDGRNIRWRGHSDTEVILAAFDKWGVEKAVKRFLGMFAFALWDRKERIFYLCRDRLGIKPLYYGLIPNGLVFGSELKVLEIHESFNKEVDRDALVQYLRYNYIPAPLCIYKNAQKLLPGHILRIPIKSIQTDNRLPESHPFWSGETIAQSGIYQPFSGSIEEAQGVLHALLRDAVKQRMISDVPIGAFLSGGVDSSTVVALMQEYADRPVKTFTIGFNEFDYNEAGHAAAIAGHLGTDHTELTITPNDALQIIPNLSEIYCEPFADASQIPTALLSKLTRKHVTVCLSGDGGDEVFGGYYRHFLLNEIWSVSRRIPSYFKHVLSAAFRKLSPQIVDRVFHSIGKPILPGRYHYDNLGEHLHKFANIFSAPDPDAMYRILVSSWPQAEKIVVGQNEYFCRNEKTLALASIAEKIMLDDLLSYLPDDILTKVDRASMAVGLEARVPLLDHRIVEFAWRLPLKMKVAGGLGKRILRRILYQYVPPSLIERPKTGFAVPIGSWLRGPLKEWASDLLNPDRLQEEGFFNPLPIRNAWDEHQSGRKNLQYRLWSILMFQCWLQRNVV